MFSWVCDDTKVELQLSDVTITYNICQLSAFWLLLIKPPAMMRHICHHLYNSCTPAPILIDVIEKNNMPNYFLIQIHIFLYFLPNHHIITCTSNSVFIYVGIRLNIDITNQTRPPVIWQSRGRSHISKTVQFVKKAKSIGHDL